VARTLRVLALAIVVAASINCGAAAPVAPTASTVVHMSASAMVVALVDVPTGVVDNTAGSTGTWNWAGQSVLIPSGGPFNNIGFNWYTLQGKATAFGALYVLKQEYLGTPGDLGPSTPGFLAKSESVANDQYVFAPSVTLESGVQYWFYTDTQGSFAGSFYGSVYPGGDMYVTGYPTLGFHKALASGGLTGPTPPPGTCVDANFKLMGAPTSR
jgi:hypothetical protein